MHSYLPLKLYLQGKCGSKHNITKNVDLSKAFEDASCEEKIEKLIHNNPILSAVIKNHLQSYDPRSPTQDFERTPIVIASKINEENDTNISRPNSVDDCDSPLFVTSTKDKITQAVMPKNLCEGFFDLTLDDTMKNSDVPLGSSTASNDSIEKNMSNESVEKPTQLLETNFDYVETDIDKYHVGSEDQYDVGSIKYRQKFKVLDNDPRSPSTGIERTPIVVAKTEEVICEENVEDMSDDKLIKALQNTNSELRMAAAEQNREGLLIYEDEAQVTAPNNIDETPKKSKSASNSGSRTPLSCMKNKTDPIHMRSKSANQLFDPKVTNLGKAKMAKRVSQIPRLKSLAASSKSSISLKNLTNSAGVAGDCENTPPTSHRDCWDLNKSIVL